MIEKYISLKEDKELNELIGTFKSQYGTKLKDVQKDAEFKKLSQADKEYVLDELKSDGFK